MLPLRPTPVWPTLRAIDPVAPLVAEGQDWNSVLYLSPVRFHLTGRLMGVTSPSPLGAGWS